MLDCTASSYEHNFENLNLSNYHMLTYNCINVKNQEPGVNSSQGEGKGEIRTSNFHGA